MSKKEYMDYGAISLPQRRPQYTYEEVKLNKSNIYRMTHDGEGKSLSFMNKAFISFTYGGKKIEDFNLIAVTIGDRLDRLTPPSHEDYITDYKMLNGQYYWGSHYNAREMTITLATDGMTQLDLDNFKYWFQAGEIRLLILSLHPNRGILARVALAPQVSVLPFKKLIKKKINEKLVLITVIEYKGNIQLHFVMDEPFWYALTDVFGDIVEDENGYSRLANYWTDADGNIILDLTDDLYKTVVEDKIPIGDMFSAEINLGNEIKIIPDKIYKYTLTDKIVEARQNGTLIGGTPLVNKLNSNGKEANDYPLSGGIVGPLYIRGFNYNETITLLNSNWIKQNLYISLVRDITLGRIMPSTYSDEYVVDRFLPAMSGSTITLTSAYPLTKLCIVLYDQKDQSFVEETWLDSSNRNYIFDKNYYAKLYISVFDLRNNPQVELQLEFNEFYDINDLIDINITTFNEQLNMVKKVLFDDIITEIKLSWIQIGKQIELFEGIEVENLDNETQIATPYIAMTEYIPIKSGSTISLKNSLLASKYISRLEGFIYDIDEQTLIDHFFVTDLYEFQDDCYIRFNIVFKKGITPSVKMINSLFNFNLLTIQIDNDLFYFYSGNAPAYPSVTFSVPFHFDDNGYIDTFNNSFNLTEEGNAYNTLTLESEFKHELKLTNPSIITSYNQVISKLLDESTTNMAISLAIQAFRLEIGHPIIRSWIINCINIYQHTYNAQDSINDSNKLLTLTTDMKHMLLLYMPYVFANYSNLDMPEFDSDPIEVYAPKEITVNYSVATQRLIQEDGEQKYIPVIPSSRFSMTLETTNVLYYQWEFSLDGDRWYVMLDKDGWTGSTTHTLTCSSITENDFDKYYRCLVSNNDDRESKYSEAIQVVNDTNALLHFISCPDDAVFQDFGGQVTLEWKAKNYKSGLTEILYKVSGSNDWNTLSTSSLTDSILNRNLTDLNGRIRFTFTIGSKNINGYTFSAKIYGRNQLIEPLNAVDNLDNINYDGTLLTVLNVLNTDSSVITIGSRDYASTTLYNNHKYNEAAQIIEGKEIKINISNIYYSINSSCFEVLAPNGTDWLNATNVTSSFFRNHIVNFQSDYGQYSLIWQADLKDNEYKFRFNARGVNGQQIYLPSEDGFKINKIVSKSLALIAPEYKETDVKKYVGDSFTIGVNDNNQGIVTYTWWYKSSIDAATWTQVTATNGISNVNTPNLSFTNAAVARSGLYKITLSKSGNYYNNDSKYITLNVYNKLKIKNDLSASSVTNLPYYSYQYTSACSLQLTCSAYYADECRWIYRINNFNQLFVNGVTSTISNNILTTTLDTDIFSYLQIQNGIQIYCEFKNNTSQDVISSNTIMPTVKLQSLPTVTIENESMVNWDWGWPLQKTEVVGTVANQIKVTTFAGTDPIPCLCEYDGYFKFSGVPITKNPDAATDKLPYYTDQDNIRTQIDNAYDANVQYAVLHKLATIKINEQLRDITWQEIILTAEKIINDTANFNIDLYLQYYTNSGKLGDPVIINLSKDGASIFNSRLPYYNQITHIDIMAQPYFKRTWTKISNLTCDYMDYYYNYIANPDGSTTRVPRYLFNLINMSGSSLRFNAVGIPQTRSRGLSKGIRLLGDNEDSSLSSIAKDIEITYNITLPANYPAGPGMIADDGTFGGYGTLEVTSALTFLKAMNNKGENYTYHFVFDKRESDPFSCGWKYNGLFYQGSLPGIYIHLASSGGSWDELEGDWYRLPLVHLPDTTILNITVTFVNLGESVVNQNLLVNLDCDKGNYNVSFNYNTIKWPGALLTDLELPLSICLLSSLRYKETYTQTEDGGDMILYNNFILNLQNHFDLSGKLNKWNENDKKLSYKVSYDGIIPLYHFNMNYKNYYL